MTAKPAKTTENSNSVGEFLDQVQDSEQVKDSAALIQIMRHESGYEAKMWGPAIVGFGSYHFKYDSGREGDAPLIAFSPRKAAISLYLSSSFEGREELLKILGKHKSAKSCVYVKRLADIDESILREMIRGSLKYTREKHAKGDLNKNDTC
ncbi:MAG: DUF1801 domain-containing protein [Saprospiraceae bacterium]